MIKTALMILIMYGSGYFPYQKIINRSRVLHVTLISVACIVVGWLAGFVMYSLVGGKDANFYANVGLPFWWAFLGVIGGVIYGLWKRNSIIPAKQKIVKICNENNDDDELFAQVAKEMVRKDIDEGLWAKAFALENGDEHKAKAHYIRLRVEKIEGSTNRSRLKAEILHNPKKEYGARKYIQPAAGLVIILFLCYLIYTDQQKPIGQATKVINPIHTDKNSKPHTARGEDRSWSGNYFDRFDSVVSIEQKALNMYPELREERPWLSIQAWSTFYNQYPKLPHNEAAYEAVSEVLSKIQKSNLICMPIDAFLADEKNWHQASDYGSYLARVECEKWK